MNANKNHLKPTYKIPGHQKLKAAVFKGLVECLADSLVSVGLGAGFSEVGFTQAPSRWNNDQSGKSQDDQSLLPPEVTNESAFNRNH